MRRAPRGPSLLRSPGQTPGLPTCPRVLSFSFLLFSFLAFRRCTFGFLITAPFRDSFRRRTCIEDYVLDRVTVKGKWDYVMQCVSSLIEYGRN